MLQPHLLPMKIQLFWCGACGRIVVGNLTGIEPHSYCTYFQCGSCGFRVGRVGLGVLLEGRQHQPEK